MNDPAENSAKRSRSAAGNARWLMVVQMALAGVALLLLLAGGWSPLRHSGVTLLSAALAAAVVIAAALGHIVKPSSGPVTQAELRYVLGGRALASRILPVATLVIPFVVVLLLVFLIYPPEPSGDAVLISALASPRESAIEESVPVKRLVSAVQSRLASHPNQSWPATPENVASVRRAFFDVLEEGIPSRPAFPRSILPEWVTTSIELAALRAAPRFWKLKSLTYQLPDLAMKRSLEETLAVDRVFYASSYPQIKVTSAAPAAESGSAGMLGLLQACYLQSDSKYHLWVLLDARQVFTAGKFDLVINGGTVKKELALPTEHLRKWVLWSAILDTKPTMVEVAGERRVPIACGHVKLMVDPPLSPELHDQMIAQVNLIDPAFQPIVTLSKDDGLMIARTSKTLGGVFLIALSEREADLIDRHLAATWKPKSFNFKFDAAVETGKQIGSLRLRATRGVTTLPVPFDRAQVGALSERLFLFETEHWTQLQSLGDWAFTYPGLFWEDIEQQGRAAGTSSARVAPAWSRLVFESEGEITIGYVIQVPRADQLDPGWNLSPGDQQLLWSMVNESGRRLIQDRLLLDNGFANLGTEAGTFLPILDAQDLLRVSSIRVRSDLSIVLFLLLLYTGAVLLIRHCTTMPSRRLL